MKVYGIDFSSTAIDVVGLSWDGHDDRDPAVYRFVLLGSDSFRRACTVRSALGDELPWHPGDLVYIERPLSHGRRVVASLMRVQGAILSCIPAGVTVNEIRPLEWKRELTGHPGASKPAVLDAVRELGFPADDFDQADAFAIAWVAREESKCAIRRAEEAA